MKKTIIKVLSVLLAVVLTFTAAPLSGFIGLDLPEWLNFSIMSKAAATSGNCGENVTWNFDESTGTLTISGTGPMDYVPWASYKESIVNLIIENGVTTICEYAFMSCHHLTSFIIPDSVTTIGDRAFSECYFFTDVTIGDGVTTIGDSVFNGCGYLTNVTMGESVKIIGDEAFYHCTSLTNITLPDSVTTIGDGAFSGCYSLTSIIIPDGVTEIGDEAFSSCEGVVSISVDSNNQYYLNDEYGVLFNKDKTTLIQYPVGNTRTSYIIPDSVTTIGRSAFNSCDSLESVTIPDSVTTIGDYAFEYCKSLTSITIPDSVTTIGNYAFYHCDSLTSVTIPDSVTIISNGTFNYCTSLTDVYYLGSEEQWNAITIGERNVPLLNATIHFTDTDNGEFIDEKTGVQIDYSSNTFDGKVEFNIEESFDGTAFDIIDTTLNTSQKVMYDITMTVDGVETQPNGKITVRIPLPEGYNPNRSFVYHIDTVNGKVEKMPAKYENGYLVFETTHFSYYAVVEEKEIILGDVNGDSKVNQLDRVILTRYIADWEGYSEENVNLDAADTNGNGRVNQLDRTILTRHIAKWEGYETLPYTK